MTNISISTPSLSTYSAQILERDLSRYIQEISEYRSEENLWVVAAQISNSAGNLAVHISGSIQHFIGAVLGNNGYVRTRDREFSDKNIAREEIIARLQKSIEVVKEVLPSLPEETLQQDLPEKIAGNSMTVAYFLLHMISHVNYHLGQVNYHRRLLDK